MPVTITTTTGVPTVGADEDAWGGELNVKWGTAKVDLDALAVLANATETVAGAALPKAGGTMTGDIALADPTPGSASSAGFRGAPTNMQDATYTLVLKDAGKTVLHTSGSAHAWTIPPNASVGFPLGTVIKVVNTGAGAVTLTRGASVALRRNGSSTDANRTLNQYGSALLEKVGTDSWLVSGPVT